MNKGKLHALDCGGLVEERRKGTGASLQSPWVPVSGERGKRGKREREREKLGRRVSGAERARIGCLLGETEGQALQSPAAEFLSAFSSFSFFLFVHTRC